MTAALDRVGIIAVAAALATTVSVMLPAQSPAQAVDVVWLAASVIHRDGRLVSDMTAADFEVLENGQLREVDGFRNDPMPIAVAIMVDISASMEGNYGLVRRAVSSLTTHFQAGDRAIVGAFNALSWISPRFSARPEVLQSSLTAALGGTLPLCDGDWIDRTRIAERSEASNRSFGSVNEFARRLQVAGGSAIWDGAACGINAVASDGETPRRIVVLITDAVDTMSFSTAASVVSRANQYGVMVYGVSVMGGYGMAGSALQSLAESTGGGYFYLTGEDQVAGAFARIGEELRRQYVIGFRPAGGPGSSSSIELRVGIPDATVRFRRVHMAGVPAPSSATNLTRPAATQPADSPLPAGLTVPEREATTVSAAAPSVGSSARRTPLWDTLDRFIEPGWPTGTAPRLDIARLRAMLDSLRQESPGWIASAPPAGQPARRLAAAAFVLDLLYTQNDPYLWIDRQPAHDFLGWAAALLDDGPATPAERLWYLGALALAERGGAEDPLDRLALRALRRFPGEARFVLARAVAQDLRTWPEERDVRAFAVAPAIAAALTARYEEAAALPDVREEALLRLGYFELRRGRADAALARFDQVQTAPADVVLRFWLALLKGRALEESGRLPEAIEMFDRALEAVPSASSARAALVAALAAAKRPSEAARVASLALTTPGAPVDPWTLYVVPDMRFWPAITAELRRAVSR